MDYECAETTVQPQGQSINQQHDGRFKHLCSSSRVDLFNVNIIPHSTHHLEIAQEEVSTLGACILSYVYTLMRIDISRLLLIVRQVLLSNYAAQRRTRGLYYLTRGPTSTRGTRASDLTSPEGDRSVEPYFECQVTDHASS